MNRPPRPRPLGAPERMLFRLFVECQLSVHPRQLYSAYSLNYEELALIAGCSLPTMERWMGQNRAPRSSKTYQRRLGEFHFLISNYRQLPPEVLDSLCRLPEEVRSILYPQDADAGSGSVDDE